MTEDLFQYILPAMPMKVGIPDLPGHEAVPLGRVSSKWLDVHGWVASQRATEENRNSRRSLAIFAMVPPSPR